MLNFRDRSLRIISTVLERLEHTQRLEHTLNIRRSFATGEVPYKAVTFRNLNITENYENMKSAAPIAANEISTGLYLSVFQRETPSSGSLHTVVSQTTLPKKTHSRSTYNFLYIFQELPTPLGSAKCFICTHQ